MDSQQHNLEVSNKDKENPMTEYIRIIITEITEAIEKDMQKPISLEDA